MIDSDDHSARDLGYGYELSWDARLCLLFDDCVPDCCEFGATAAATAEFTDVAAAAAADEEDGGDRNEGLPLSCLCSSAICSMEAHTS
jgi:hypothetical protein